MNRNWKRYEKIKGEHEDWAKYTGDKTFYDVLNLIWNTMIMQN